jgi:hypothetical protein
VGGFAPSFSAHVRLGEHAAPVLFPIRLVTLREENVESCGIPHLANNERDAPNFLHAALNITACAPFFKERRMRFAGPTTLHRKSGVWGTRGLVEGIKFGFGRRMDLRVRLKGEFGVSVVGGGVRFP